MTEPLVIRGRPPRSSAVVLLQGQGLPVSDITDVNLEHLFSMGSDASTAAVIGLEIYGNVALLRSLVVVGKMRTRGVGRALVQHAEDYAAARHVGVMYLLATTAEGFFQRLGYRRVDRNQAPSPIKSTPEFESLCPASWAFMCTQLQLDR